VLFNFIAEKLVDVLQPIQKAFFLRQKRQVAGHKVKIVCDATRGVGEVKESFDDLG
jgi:hypothetical protein